MKFKIIISCVLVFYLFFSLELFAQSTDKDRYDDLFGVEGGINISNVSESPASSTPTESKLGMVIGLLTERVFKEEPYSFVAGIYYKQLGFNFEFDDAKYDYKLDYLASEIFGKYKFKISETNPFLLFGFNIGLKLSAEYEESYLEITPGSLESSSIDNLDAGLLFGGGVEHKTSPSFAVFLNLKYYWGLRNIYEDNEDVKLTNYTLQITSGIRFGL